MGMMNENVSGQRAVSVARTSVASSEGQLCDPPPLVQRHLVDEAPRTPFWQDASPVSDPAHEMATLRMAWRELDELLADRPAAEAPEVFEMPTVLTQRVRARVRYVAPAPFVFVDELADASAEPGE